MSEAISSSTTRSASRGGIRFDLRHLGFELSGGYAFDRFYFEGGGYSNHNENRIDIHGGPFVVGRIMLRF
jgi:hypothetical protein